VFERVIYEDKLLEKQFKDSSSENGNNNDNIYDQQQRNGTDSSTQDQRQQQTIRAQSQQHHHQYNGSNASGSDISAAVSALGPCAADAYLMFKVL